ncbi:hypothetical protein Tco_1041265 [Tanacetum coccineum]|uniref:Ubiquitin-like protease family profile domain-containing protein n=1 Tax=Tanacetum coccineum TaxID=301880 RepID=A0ABQ5GFM7_9ASTR
MDRYEDASKQGRKINDIDKDAEITLVHETQGRYSNEEMFDTVVLDGDAVLAESEVTVKDVNLSVDEVTLAQALATLKSVKVQEKANVVEELSESITTTPTLTTTTAATTITAVRTRPKAKGFVIHEEEQETTPIVSSQQPSKDKGKGIMIEEPVKIKKKDQISLDEELAFKLQAEEEEEEERLAREKAQREEEANIVSWDNVQAMIDVDYQMAQQMKAEEQKELSIEEKSKLFVKLLEAKKKHFAAMRAQEMRNKPPTKAQKRNTMSTYLKNMARYKHNQLKNKSFNDILKLFDKAMKRVNTFVDMDTELVKESTKKQKVDDEELKKCLEIIPDDGDDVTIDATPLSTKSPTIVDYKIYKEGKKSYFQIIRADGNSQMYLTFGKMLKNFNREDLEVLWSIVKARFKKTEPVNYMDNFLLLNLKTMFEHHVEDNVWKNQQGLVKVLNWKLYDSCGVHCVTMQNILYYLLVEKMYPLTNHTLHQMFNDVKLQVDYECEMAFELLRLVKKQLKEGYVPE